jgi:alpha,alpha-trehalose phosphorylase
LRNSDFRVASACAAVGAQQGAEGEALHWRFAGEAHAEAPFEALKLTAYASDRGDPARDPAGAVTEALEWGAGRSFDALVETQRRALDAYWEAAHVALPAHPALERAARYNLLQLFQAVGRDGESSIPAKGQTGEGYEGHVFWDADCFMLPMFAFLAPDRARSMLEFRSKGLDKARAIARLMGHARGALFPWRTIGGEECSAFFPAGTAQYHINADIAYAVRIYAAATGDEALLDAFGVELLLETARIWLEIGHHRADGQFCIDKVTGPDEYSALVDNNYYTNAMAKAHLEDAVRQAEAMAARAPQAFQALAARIRYTAPEGEEMRRAARAMRLPVCAERGVLAQDDAFLSKQVWDFAGTPPERYPLLLHHHPLTIYRRQVCKQADAVLALALAGRGLDSELKRRTFAYYEGVTTHDSTLSPSGFATAAAQAGLLDQAFAYLRMTTLVDLEDLCGNADHGLHMAAMAGGWLALAFGFAGVDVEGGALALTPRFGAALGPYGLRLRYRGRLLSLEVSREGVVYRLERGEALEITHLGAPLLLQPGRAAAAELAP